MWNCSLDSVTACVNYNLCQHLTIYTSAQQIKTQLLYNKYVVMFSPYSNSAHMYACPSTQKYWRDKTY